MIFKCTGREKIGLSFDCLILGNDCLGIRVQPDVLYDSKCAIFFVERLIMLKLTNVKRSTECYSIKFCKIICSYICLG